MGEDRVNPRALCQHLGVSALKVSWHIPPSYQNTSEVLSTLARNGDNSASQLSPLQTDLPAVVSSFTKVLFFFTIITN